MTMAHSLGGLIYMKMWLCIYKVAAPAIKIAPMYNIPTNIWLILFPSCTISEPRQFVIILDNKILFLHMNMCATFKHLCKLLLNNV